MTTAYIVGKGPSLLELTASDFGPGPVITLNQAVVDVRKLHLPNQIYCQQKDGCVGQNRHQMPPPRHVCPPTSDMVTPVQPETVLLSRAESPTCFYDYPNRVVIDVEALLPGRRWFTPSSPVAAAYAVKVLGCDSLVFLAHDSYMNGDLRRVMGSELVYDHSNDTYATNSGLAKEIADELGVLSEWRWPRSRGA